MTTLTSLALSLSCLFLQTPAQPPAAASVQGYYRFPALTDSELVFAAEGDLWKVPIAGGVATRLTSHPGNESSPFVSPDGSLVAFAAQYEGPVEVYTMPVGGGLPTRRTWFGGRSSPVGFAPGGGGPESARLLVATRRFSTLPNMQAGCAGPRHALAHAHPARSGRRRRLRPERQSLFHAQDFQGSHTRRYTGGTVEQLWKLDASGFAKPEVEAIALTSDYDGTSASPMFFDGRVYFRSDRAEVSSRASGAAMNIWSMTPDGKDFRQHTFHNTFEVKSPRLRATPQGAKIAYQLGADIWILDVGSSKTAAVPITLSTDLDQTRERWIAKPMDYLTSAHLSPDGDRVALTARGQVFVAPRKFGRLVEATHSAAARARDARFNPDGKSLLMLSDQTGEIELWTAPANGVGEPTRLTTDADVLRWEAVPSPDGKFIAHHDKNQRLWIFDTEKKTSAKIDENSIDSFTDLRWSRDGRWLAYSAYSSNLNIQIKLYDTRDQTITQVTSDRTNSSSPAWSPDGKFLYFLSERNLESVVSSPWGPAQPEPFFDKKTRVYAVALKPGTRWLFAEPDEPAAQGGEEGRCQEGRKARRGKKGGRRRPWWRYGFRACRRQARNKV